MHLARHRLRLVAGLAAVATLGTAGLSYAAVNGGDLSLNGAARQNGPDRSAEVAAAINPGKAKNVILLIGDGMGDSEITSARNYAEGAAGRLKGIDALPLTGQYTTYSLNRTTGLPDYVPDSSATGSAWATGTKTYDNAVSVDIRGVAQQTILELAKSKGLKTGNVTTSEIQDATPAVQVSHISARSCYGPDNTKLGALCPEAALERGGLGSITEQMLATRPDVTLGGGAATFAQTATGGAYAGRTLNQQAIDRGYQMVSDKAGLAAVTSADQTRPVLGLFGAGNLPVRYTGPLATKGGDALPAVTCTPNPALPATQPTLADMTTKAISLLDNPSGFFLQVEGASLDKRDHSSDACGQIGEVVDLDEAVQVALAFAKKEGNTSVFVTADHAHTSQIVEVVPAGGTSSTPGSTVTLQTKDGVPMAISYATSTGSSQQHTGTQLRVAGYGPRAANIVGLTDQTDLFFTMKDALFGAASTTPPVVVPPVTPPALSSVGASVKVVPGAIRRGGVAVVVGQGFKADTSVKITIKGNGKAKTKTKPVTGGTVVLTVRGAKVGTAKVTVRGVQSGVTDKAKVTIKK